MKRHISLYLPDNYEYDNQTAMVLELLNRKGYEYDVRCFSYASQTSFMLDIHRDFAVLVDCTIPDDLDIPTIYPILTAHINVLNHIIAFSRTTDDKGFEILPLNIVPQRKRTEKDQDLTKWIETQLNDIEVHKDEYERVEAESLEDLLNNKSSMEHMMTMSLAMNQKKESNKRSVMISYRNKYASEVEALKKEAEASGKYDVKALPPGSLCGEYEAHTPMRRWMLVGLLEDHLRTVDEVWVYLTDDYTDSWWTLAEIIMTANLNKDRSSDNAIQISVFDAKTSRFLDKKDYPSFITPIITEEQHKRLARYLSNTRPDTMGPEMIQQVRQMKQLAKILRYSPNSVKENILSNLKDSLQMAIPSDLPDDDKRAMLEDLVALYSNPDELEKYASEEVFQEVFWKNISYQTEKQTPAFVNGSIDVDSFMHTPMQEITKLDDTKLSKAYAKKGAIKIGNANYTIEPGNTRYLWLATRMGQPTVKDAPGLEVINTYNLVQ